jgi:hypothetical protein
MVPSHKEVTMAKRKKRRVSKAPPQDYQVIIDDWDVRYSFVANAKSYLHYPALYWENSNITIYGRFTQPVYKDVSKA